jgi:ADP-L-glycero-D-manno-heptose 6-epimerase
MIAITGAAGFIGSCLIRHLNDQGLTEIVAIDDFSSKQKIRNLADKKFAGLVHRDDFIESFRHSTKNISVIFHLGARTDTTEKDPGIFKRLNLNYSKDLWKICTQSQIPFIYASSAATYGDGVLGYNDDHDIVSRLRPLNLYGISKNDFDKWALSQDSRPPRWVGMKFFNVYGPNEYHKDRMASVIWHTWKQIQSKGRMQLFKSHRANIADGQQKRDFIYVKDVVKICDFLYKKSVPSGLYNIGTGQARSFLDLANQTFLCAEKTPVIDFIDTPRDIRNNYQYFTEANIGKLLNSGYVEPLYTLEMGIKDYVSTYLKKTGYF